MPFTPFHFGPGLFLKSIGPRWLSFTAFALTQVVIDLESLYNILNHRWPIHRFFHSIPGSILAGLVAAALLAGFRASTPRWSPPPIVAGDFHWIALLGGGIIGGVSHSLLDTMFHRDVRFFYPAGQAGVFYGLLSHDAIHLGCVGLGLVGVLVICHPASRASRGGLK